MGKLVGTTHLQESYAVNISSIIEIIILSIEIAILYVELEEVLIKMKKWLEDFWNK